MSPTEPTAAHPVPDQPAHHDTEPAAPDLDAIRARLDAHLRPAGSDASMSTHTAKSAADAAFTVHAPEDVRALLARVAELEADVQALQQDKAAVAGVAERARARVAELEAQQPDRAALRDRIAEAIAVAEGWTWAHGVAFTDIDTPTADTFRDLADAVLAVLPDPAATPNGA